jgi:hypothetical protein
MTKKKLDFSKPLEFVAGQPDGTVESIRYLGSYSPYTDFVINIIVVKRTHGEESATYVDDFGDGVWLYAGKPVLRNKVERVSWFVNIYPGATQGFMPYKTLELAKSDASPKTLQGTVEIIYEDDELVDVVLHKK